MRETLKVLNEVSKERVAIQQKGDDKEMAQALQRRAACNEVSMIDHVVIPE